MASLALVVAAATPLGGDYAGDVRTMGNVLELTRDISDRFRRNDVRLGPQRELVAIQLTEEPPASAGPSSLPTLHAQGERLLALLAQLKQEVTVSGERMNAIKSTLSVLLQLDEGAAAGPPSLLQLELRLGNASQDGHQQARLRRRAAALSLVPPQPDEAAPAAGGAGPALLPAAGSDGTLARLERRKAEQLERDALDGALSAPAPSSGGGARAGGGGPARPPAEQALDVLLDAVKAMVLRRRPPVDEQVATLWETTRRLAAISKDYADKIKFMRSNVVNFAQIEESYPAGPAAIPGPAAAAAAAADAAAADGADLEPAADGAAAAAWPGSPADSEMVEASAQRATAAAAAAAASGVAAARRDSAGRRVAACRHRRGPHQPVGAARGREAAVDALARRRRARDGRRRRRWRRRRRDDARVGRVSDAPALSGRARRSVPADDRPRRTRARPPPDRQRLPRIRRRHWHRRQRRRFGRGRPRRRRRPRRRPG